MKIEEEPQEEVIDYEARTYGIINNAGLALTFIALSFGPFSENYPENTYLLSLGITFGYMFVTFISLSVSGLDSDSDLAYSLQTISWAWLLYWLYFKGLILPAFVGHLLFLGTIGRMLIFYKWYKKKQYKEKT